MNSSSPLPCATSYSSILRALPTVGTTELVTATVCFIISPFVLFISQAEIINAHA